MYYRFFSSYDVSIRLTVLPHDLQKSRRTRALVCSVPNRSFVGSVSVVFEDNDSVWSFVQTRVLVSLLCASESFRGFCDSVWSFVQTRALVCCVPNSPFVGSVSVVFEDNDSVWSSVQCCQTQSSGTSVPSSPVFPSVRSPCCIQSLRFCISVLILDSICKAGAWSALEFSAVAVRFPTLPQSFHIILMCRLVPWRARPVPTGKLGAD